MLGKKLRVLLLTIFVIAAFSVTGYTFPLDDGEVFKIKVKDECYTATGPVKVKFKHSKGLHMRVFFIDAEGNEGQPGYIPAHAEVIFYTSTKKNPASTSSPILGKGKLYADYPTNYVVKDGMVVRKDCSLEACAAAKFTTIDGYIVTEPEFVAKPEKGINSCDLVLQGLVVSDKKKKIKGWTSGVCGAIGTPDSDGVATISNGFLCTGKFNSFKGKQITK